MDLAHTYFPYSKVIIDKYHFVRQVTWAIEKVRKSYRNPCLHPYENTISEAVD
ncbi:transposase [Anaerocolumna aminovalerica]|uniref:transposase n=1 Tax=Anaerocolumna aminovalerica TaxID=1527 RepID=UPI0020A04EA2|nr:transposase [Anaerocolumna aminovalerica]